MPCIPAPDEHLLNIRFLCGCQHLCLSLPAGAGNPQGDRFLYWQKVPARNGTGRSGPDIGKPGGIEDGDGFPGCNIEDDCKGHHRRQPF